MADQALEFVRDSLNGLRSDISKVFDRLDDAVNSNQALHRDVEARLGKLEAAHAAKPRYAVIERLPWLPLAWRIAWPLVLMYAALWRTAPEPTKHQVRAIAADAAGIKLPEAASAKPQITPASTTWVRPGYIAGGPR